MINVLFASLIFFSCGSLVNLGNYNDDHDPSIASPRCNTPEATRVRIRRGDDCVLPQDRPWEKRRTLEYYLSFPASETINGKILLMISDDFE